ncbi:MAG: hypothetical protein EPO39_09555 [Candidatus Manganitrophaceae bacterium]|nr:MAG: hypothetical protein EPO39_09555 [Candidatus Manganitrophaceae bacterium]
MGKKGFLSVVVASVLMSAFMWGFTQEARAIPAFSRSTQAPCALCHTGFPKLNAFGMMFKQNGYRMPGQEGKFLWEQPIPLSGQISFSYRYRKDNWNPEVVGLIGMPELPDRKSSALGMDGWELLAGGTVAPRVSFLGAIGGEVSGLAPDAGIDPATGMPDTATTEIETEAFVIQFNDLVSDARLNLRIGKDHIDNYFLSTPRRLTEAPYLIQIQPMLGPSLMPTSVGAELNGFLPVGFRYAAGVRNYGSAYDSKNNNEQRVGAVYVWANQDILGQTVSFIVSSDRAGDANVGADDQTLGYGASLDLSVWRINIIPGVFWYREGDRIRGGNRLEVVSGTLEAIYPILPTLLGTLRYDFNNWDIKNDPLNRDARQYVVSLAWYSYPNIRCVAEYSRLSTANLMPVGAPGGIMLMDTGAAESDLRQDKATLLVQVTF